MLKYIDEIKAKKVLVIGDVMLDEYYYGAVERISPEAPVPVFKKKNDRFVLGGAANVANNLIAARQHVSIATVIGDDENGNKLKDCLIQNNIMVDLVVSSCKRSTTVKTRFLATNNQQVMRLDVEDNEDIDNSDETILINLIEKNIDKFDIVIISDYKKGVLTQNITQKVINLAKKNNVKTLVDVKDKNFMKYAGAYLIKPNLNELSMMIGKNIYTEEEIIAESQQLIKKLDCQFLLTTRGNEGMTLVSSQKWFSVAATKKEVFDVTGAGDTTIAYLAACLANNIPIEDCIEIANRAAGIQVTKSGTSSVFVDELMDISQFHKNKDKLIDFNKVEQIRKRYKNKKIVFTNGCFDILHVGHIRYLEQASKLGDLLVVGVNSDASVKRLKGKDRPINNENERAEILCALKFVDFVIIFEQDTPYELIKNLQPDYLVKGGDYVVDEIVGKDIVENSGGKVIVLPFVDGKSTTSIINKIATEK